LNTNFAKKQLRSSGCIPEKTIIIPQGLPLDEYEYLQKKCPSHGESLHLLSVGRFHRDKGHKYALLAVARLVRLGIKTNYSLVGVGPEKEKLRNMIYRLGLTDHVQLYENLDDVSLKNLYKVAHLFIFPSIDNKHGEHVETQGVVLQEAQASGCIPIATRVGGIPECVNDKKDAILVKDRSSKAICEAVRYLLNRPEEWQCFQENGRRNVEQNFSADVIGKRMAGILRGIAAEGKKN
jgi:glycosyltransferase involved in cell wall biosynthesis